MVPIIIAARWGASSVGQVLARLGVRRFRPSALKWMAAAVGFYLFCSFAYTVLIGQPHQENIAKHFGVPAVQVLLIVFAAPICEEVCFRGMLFGGLRERLPRDRRGADQRRHLRRPARDDRDQRRTAADRLRLRPRAAL